MRCARLVSSGWRMRLRCIWIRGRCGDYWGWGMAPLSNVRAPLCALSHERSSGERVGVRGAFAPDVFCRDLDRLQRAFEPLPGPESLFFACSRARRSGREQRSWPEGRRAWMPGVKKSNQKKEHPGASPFGYVRVGRAFRQGFLPWRKGIDIHVDAPAGLVVRPSPTHRGPEVKSRIKSSALCAHS